MPEARSKVTKKTAVKAVTTKAVPKKKTPTKKVAKKPAPGAKKTPTKRKPAVKKVTKVVGKSKKIAKKTAVKKTVKAPAKKGQKTTGSVEKKARKDVVVLPVHMSIRAREKALVWAEEFENKLREPVYALSMTLGALFILFGSYSGLHSSDLFANCDGGKCSAELISGSGTPSDTETEQLVPEVELIAEIPAEINTSYEIFVDTVYTQRIYAELKFTGTGGSLENRALFTANRLNGRFSILIPADELNINQYTLRVKAYDDQDVSHGYTTLGSFEVTGEEPQGLVSQPTQTDSPDLIQLPGETDEVDLVSQPEPIDDTEPLVSQPTNDSSQDDSEAEATGDTTVSDQREADTEDLLLETISAPEEVENRIVITTESVLSGAAPVTIKSTKFQFISIYLRRLQSTQEQLVKTISTKETVYQLNTADFPNGMYELTVRTTSKADDTVSNSLEIKIENQTEPLVDIEPTTTPLVEEERPVLRMQSETPRETTQNVEDDEGVFADKKTPSVAEQVSKNDAAVQQTLSTALTGPIKQRTLDRLETDTDVLDQLFTRYAAAVQSGNPDMLREAQNAIDRYQRSIVDSALANPEDRFIADDLSKSLDAEIQQITARVETFENLRRQRSEGEVSKDTDGDGITDIDERLLFDTDPLRADTDGDGFTDGAEIIRGFDPVDAASEAVIIYKSPKETIGVASNDDLQVIEVTPDVVLPNVVDQGPSIQATIRGRALPNSFVTLYVFSTPTVVTVKTEADGSFEYTFNKELEDGEHQVFVALTDNTGDIVAQSEPFTFIKQAEAFTAVDAQAVISQGETTSIVTRGVSSYQTVLSMSVLALGILLVMLGAGLRSNRPNKLKFKTQA